MLGKPFFGNTQAHDEHETEPSLDFALTRPADPELEREYKESVVQVLSPNTRSLEVNEGISSLQNVFPQADGISWMQKPKKPLRRALRKIRHFLYSKIETRVEADKEASRKIYALEEESRKLREEVGYLRNRNRQQAEEIVLLTEDTIPGALDTIPSNRFFERPLTRDSRTMMTGFGTSSPAGESAERETVPVKRENVLEKQSVKRETIMNRFGKSVKEMVEAYDKWPTPVKIAISAGFIGIGILGVATGSGAIIAASWVGKVAARGMGSYLAGRTAEKLLRARKMRKVLPGSQLNKQDEKSLKHAQYGVMVAAFLAGSIGDIKEYIPNSVVEHFTNMFAGNSPVNTVNHSGIPATNIDTPRYDLPVTDNVPASYQVDLPSQADLPEVVSFLPNTIAEHISIVTPTNNTLTGILLNEGLPEMLSADELAKLTAQGKQNLIGNIIKHLTEEQLRDLGIKSMNANILEAGEIIDIKKLAQIAKDMTVSINGEKMSLLERALKIS